MPIKVNGKTYYRTGEAARIACVSRSTLMRWLENGTIKETPHRDRRGWRLFTQADIKTVKKEAGKVE